MEFLGPMIAIIVIVNIFSYALFNSNADEGCNLYIQRECQLSRKMNYFLPGIMDQAEIVYQFVENNLEGGITYVNYKNAGWSPQYIASQIMHDIHVHNYQQVTIFAISISDKIARHIDLVTNSTIQIITINPCPIPKTLKLPWRIAAKISAITLTIVSMLIGWLSILPIIPMINGCCSIKLLVDQLLEMAYGEDVPHSANHTAGVIISLRDQYLDNRRIIKLFQQKNVPIYPLNTKHAYTVREPRLYLGAVKKILS